uniref:Protein kinase domain-containing protein n=1 Tax=Mesocestoides corti TaxID=53468 RepID=A0A5K3FM36_MESCO
MQSVDVCNYHGSCLKGTCAFKRQTGCVCVCHESSRVANPLEIYQVGKCSTHRPSPKLHGCSQFALTPFI